MYFFISTRTQMQTFDYQPFLFRSALRLLALFE
jgi:hypothetical protein